MVIQVLVAVASNCHIFCDMDVKEAGLTSFVHFVSEPRRNRTESSLSTSGIEDDSGSSSQISTDSRDSFESYDKKPDKLAITIPDHPVSEVKFELDDRDSIISDSNCNDDDFEAKKPKIPDGGWGWVVVLASLIISMIADGISFSFGLLYIEFLHEFNESKSKTAWIGSLFMAGED